MSKQESLQTVLSFEALRQLTQNCRITLIQQQADLIQEFIRLQDNQQLLYKRSTQVDEALRLLWNRIGVPDTLTLVAVGGYGRGELYPYSDVDILILVPTGLNIAEEPNVEKFIGVLWDVGLEVGHSVRTVSECLHEASQDITVQTALLEARYLSGNKELFATLETTLAQARDPAAFCRAKQLEQHDRYARHNDTPYSLEPNCKESPGGLRDLQVILWVARAASFGRTWKELAEQELLTDDEAAQLREAEAFLETLRITLHLLIKRREDRLLFDHQEKVAEVFGIQPAQGLRASEILMQRYYRNAKLITQLNSLVLQNLNIRLTKLPAAAPMPVDSQFQVIRQRLDIRDPNTFQQDPSAILRAFLLLEQRAELGGMTSRTLRALWRAKFLIDDNFRANPANRALFLKLFQQRHLIRALRLMNQYDILGQYLPNFGKIVGQMQHDLFHVYTVDQHIMQVLRNLRRFTQPEYAHEHPFCSRLMSGFDRPWLLYIAAIFHDIAKGRGGDHSKKGMADAQEFCDQHEIGGDDAKLVVFLVERHLLMSSTAQKQDLSDPDVISKFAAIVQNQRQLTALYLLTVADVRGTSPKVWNAWKGKLLEDLFRATSRHLRGDAPYEVSGVSERQEAALTLLRQAGLQRDVEKEMWNELDTTYFMHHDADEIAWHTRVLYHRSHSEKPVVMARLNPVGEGLQVMSYVPDQPFLFARLCGFFTKYGYSIVDAKVHTTRHGYALDSFILLNDQDHLPYRDMIGLIEHDLVEVLLNPPPLEATPRGRLSRQVRHFPVVPKVSIRADEKGSLYIMVISAADRPGLLYSVACILSQHNIQLHTAKVTTLGERVEDVFLISGRELAKSASLVKLEEDLMDALQV